MKTWKPVVFGSTAALFLFASVQNARAGECHDQPNMAKAMHSLEKAKEDLEKAEHNKGGWRVAAIKHVEDSLKETHRGCEFANGH